MITRKPITTTPYDYMISAQKLVAEIRADQPIPDERVPLVMRISRTPGLLPKWMEEQAARQAAQSSGK